MSISGTTNLPPSSSLPPQDPSATGRIQSGVGAQFTDISEARQQLQGLIDSVAGSLARSDLPLPSSPSSKAASSTLNAIGQLSLQEMQTDIYAVMALVAKSAQQQRNSARELRHSEMAAQVKSLTDAAQEIRNAAKDRLAGAILSGTMQIGAGAVQIGGAAKTMKATQNALGQSGVSDAQLGALTQVAAGYNTTTQAVGQVMTGTGSILGGIMEHQAAQHDARKAELEAAAKAHETATQQAGDVMQQMQDMLRDIRDKLTSMDQSRSETARGIARNI
ncbi:type III secretion system translocon subunit SctB [Comamonas flocculans]|uniref:Uncharacterized protein n=1 Tax=Comamonas flocculans TaxID=2597701 RepID=A0A5B8RWW4_9BURK|nr:type III secretion system translocon subunit SctB [Comamonas flocculans]QEA13168.1 hypothetical protein FOZ74_09065 [Comamonas flocculans]